MAYVIVAVDMPAVLNGKKNGQLPLSILRKAPGLSGGPAVTLVTPAMRAYLAMRDTALSAGITLNTTSTADSYRPLAVQTAIFQQRYSSGPVPGWIDIRYCNGVKYYQRPGTAMAACPGTSNHGWALAVDIANASGARLDWLEHNAARFGFSWETLAELWHIRYVTGDAIPRAVLDWEDEQMALTQADADLVATAVVAKWLGSSGPTLGLAVQSTYSGVQQINAKLDAALPPDLIARLNAILAAALDDDDVTVTLPPESIEVIQELLDAVAALPDTTEVRDAVADLGEGGAAAVRADAV